MKRVGQVLLAVGSGLGVWLLTHLGDAGFTDLLIVLAFIGLGSWLTAEQS